MQCIDKQLDLSPNSYDFDPPLKREKATIPYYWTLEELANELGFTDRKVQYDVTKNRLFAYRVGKIYLVPDDVALQYLSKLLNKS